MLHVRKVEKNACDARLRSIAPRKASDGPDHTTCRSIGNVQEKFNQRINASKKSRLNDGVGDSSGCSTIAKPFPDWDKVRIPDHLIRPVGGQLDFCSATFDSYHTHQHAVRDNVWITIASVAARFIAPMPTHTA